jgi:hypothetical protein
MIEAAEQCGELARLRLLEAGEALGEFCIRHFHIERDRLHAEGRRSAVVILEEIGAGCRVRALL